MRPLAFVLGVCVMLAASPRLLADENSNTDKSVERFQRALEKHPNDAALRYNLGTSFYRKADYPKAGEALSKALSISQGALQAKAAYNRGNTNYRLAQAQESTNPQEAVAAYEQALGDFRMAIRHDPNDRDAQFNYELASRRLEKLKKQMQAAKSKAKQKAGEQQNKQGMQGKQAQQQGAQQKEGTEGQQAPSEDQSGKQESAQVSKDNEDKVSPAQQSNEQQAKSRNAATPLGSGREKPASEREALSKQQALWILDSVRDEERQTRIQRAQKQAREAQVEDDW